MLKSRITRCFISLIVAFFVSTADIASQSKILFKITYYVFFSHIFLCRFSPFLCPPFLCQSSPMSMWRFAFTCYRTHFTVMDMTKMFLYHQIIAFHASFQQKSRFCHYILCCNSISLLLFNSTIMPKTSTKNVNRKLFLKCQYCWQVFLRGQSYSSYVIRCKALSAKQDKDKWQQDAPSNPSNTMTVSADQRSSESVNHNSILQVPNTTSDLSALLDLYDDNNSFDSFQDDDSPSILLDQKSPIPIASMIRRAPCSFSTVNPQTIRNRLAKPYILTRMKIYFAFPFQILPQPLFYRLSIVSPLMTLFNSAC